MAATLCHHQALEAVPQRPPCPDSTAHTCHTHTKHTPHTHTHIQTTHITHTQTSHAHHTHTYTPHTSHTTHTHTYKQTTHITHTQTPHAHHTHAYTHHTHTQAQTSSSPPALILHTASALSLSCRASCLPTQVGIQPAGDPHGHHDSGSRQCHSGLWMSRILPPIQTRVSRGSCADVSAWEHHGLRPLQTPQPHPQ